MSIFGIGRPDPRLLIEGERVWLRPPEPQDYVDWAALRAESRNFLQPWEPTWAPDDLSRFGFRRRLKRYQRDQKESSGYTFFLFGKDSGLLSGGVTVSNIRRGVTQSAALGYWMGERYAGRGAMTDGARAVVRWCFEDLGLHRVEAACLPANEPSKQLLLRIGFSLEGQARQYLKINGAWRDHLLFARLASDPGG